MKPILLRAVALVSCLRLAVPAPSADWPMLGRESSRNAVSPEKTPLLRWQIEERYEGVLTQPGWNVLWEARLGRASFAPPTVAGGFVWVGTNNDRPRDPGVKGDHAVLMCFRVSDGRFLWQYTSPRLKNHHQDYSNAGINCSPLVEGDRLYFTTNRAEVLCFDIAPLTQGRGEPRLLWKLDLMKDLGVLPVGTAMNIGYSCSLSASYRGRLHVGTGHGVDEQGRVVNPNAPSLVCLDRDTGKVLWQDASPGKNILEVQWSSPLVVESKGLAQVIVGQGDGWVRSFDALTGKPLWQFDTNPKDAVWDRNSRRLTTRNYLIATPVYAGGYVYIANGQSPADGGPGPGRLFCIDPTRRGDISPELPDGRDKGKPNPNSGAVWCFDARKDKPEEGMQGTISNVVVHEGLVIAPVQDGYVHCLDARTGKRYWTHDIRAGILSSPLVVGGNVYLGTSDGEVLVFALAKKKKLLAVNPVGPSVDAAPVFVGGVLYLSAGGQLYAIRPDGKDDRAPGHWPQWRGLDRSNVSSETWLLKQWPKEGPPLAWKATGLGEGVAPVTVAGGRVYTLGYRDGHERLVALEERTGKLAWAVSVGPAVPENVAMRWLTQRVPTVDEDRIYVATARGEVVCLAARDGKELWRKDYRKDFEGRSGPWGFGDRPLVDGEALICVPGGEKATIVALHRKTGAVLWKCAVPGGDVPDHGATVTAGAGRVRQYLVTLSKGLVGVGAKDGKLLWRYDGLGGAVANCYTPIAYGEHIFTACGYGKGMALLKVEPTGDGFQVKEQYHQKVSLPSWQEALLRFEHHVYACFRGKLVCLELAMGKVLWEERSPLGQHVSMTAADGHLYLRAPDGKVALVEASAKGYTLRGLFQVPDGQTKYGTTAPVVAGGRLYLRDDDRLLVHDVKDGTAAAGKPDTVVVPAPAGPAPRRGRDPDAVFVPTPQDVVEKMLELAGVRKGDVVYDLGCGDGRIVVTAARKYGCRAAGFDIDPECVRMSRDNVGKAGVETLVTIERKDLFTLDLSGADVITLYLLPRMNERLLPQLAKLKPGSRVVCHANPIPGIRPNKVVPVVSKEDELAHKVYVYVTPLKK